MDEQLIALYHRHAATAFDRKLRFAEFVAQKAGRAKPKYAVETATLAFGPSLRFEAPLLGSHARGNHSWLWAWANRNLKLTLTNRALGDLVRVTAHRVGVPALAHPGLSLEPLFGPDLTEHAAEILGAVLGRELGYDAHHTIPEDGYDSAVLVRHDRLKFTERYPLHRVLTVFPKAVAALTVLDHRAALNDYARDYGLTVTVEHSVLTITDGQGTLTATFDDHDRLAKLEGTGVASPLKKTSKTTVKKPAKPAKKTAPKKTAAKKTAAKKTAPKRTVAKRPAPKQKGAKKPVAKQRVVKAAKKKPARKR